MLKPPNAPDGELPWKTSKGSANGLRHGAVTRQSTLRLVVSSALHVRGLQGRKGWCPRSPDGPELRNTSQTCPEGGIANAPIARANPCSAARRAATSSTPMSSAPGTSETPHCRNFGLQPVNPKPRLAVLTDYPDEGWISMDLCAEMLLAHLPRTSSCAVAPEPVCPPFRRLFSHLPVAGRRHTAFNADRLTNRFVHFPRYARRLAPRFDLFHVVDHSYAQLVLALPRDRVGVYCHDLDAFRCLVDPVLYPRPYWFRTFARRVLSGLQRAAVIFHSTAMVRDELLRFGLIDPGRLVHAPFGMSMSSPPTGRRARPFRSGSRTWTADHGCCTSAVVSRGNGSMYSSMSLPRSRRRSPGSDS